MKPEDRGVYLKELKTTYKEKQDDVSDLIDTAKSLRERIALNGDIEQLKWRIRYLEKIDNS